MKLPWHRERTSPGQALVEFAIVLPILALLLVMAIDFGRVFFGWVSLTNAARVGANWAGQHPGAWGPGGDTTDFESLVENSVVGCDLQTPIDPPVFSDVDGDSITNGYGDYADLTLTCDFSVLTPLAGAIVGDPLPISASSTFPVRDATFAGPALPPPGGGGGCGLAIVPDLVNRNVADAEGVWYAAGFDASTFTASPSDPTFMVKTQTFSAGAAVGDCADPSTTVFVMSEAPGACPSGESPVPKLIGLSIADARALWSADFSGDFLPTSAPDTKLVLTQKTDPVADPVIGGCIAAAAEVTVSYGDPPASPCDVPNMVNLSQAAAEKAWSDAGFTSALKVKGGGQNPVVKEQKPGHPGTVSCDVAGEIKLG